MDERQAVRFSNAPGYPEAVQSALKEMHRQVGDLVVGPDGTAERGLLVRHLVMPEDVASSTLALTFIAKEISVHTYVNIMDQYRPEYRASDYPEIRSPGDPPRVCRGRSGPPETSSSIEDFSGKKRDGAEIASLRTGVRALRKEIETHQGRVPLGFLLSGASPHDQRDTSLPEKPRRSTPLPSRSSLRPRRPDFTSLCRNTPFGSSPGI